MSWVIRSRMGLIALIAASVLAVSAARNGGGSSDPWTAAQLVPPDTLNKLLAETQGAKPLILSVGFRALYGQGHIPGSQYIGPASKPEGLAELKKAAQKLPRDKEIVLYCGCCPWNECPNIRPAFRALKEMGFLRVKVVSIPTSFAVDWVGKGYPIERGK